MSEIEPADPKPWLTKAERDLTTAETLMATKAELADMICFHCQQAAEKYLKAYLVAKGQRFGKIHDVEFLTRVCADQDGDFRDLVDVARLLSRYSVEPRYPQESEDPFSEYTPEEGSQAIKAARKFRDFVTPRLSAP